MFHLIGYKLGKALNDTKNALCNLYIVYDYMIIYISSVLIAFEIESDVES